MKFDWDSGNSEHALKHGLTIAEIESVFEDANRTFLPTYEIAYETGVEERYMVVGLSDKGYIRTIIFTFRDEKIRVVSARGSRKTEKAEYQRNLGT